MISDFRMIHPGLGGHHPRKQDDGYFFLRFFFGKQNFSNIILPSSCEQWPQKVLGILVSSWVLGAGNRFSSWFECKLLKLSQPGPNHNHPHIILPWRQAIFGDTRILSSSYASGCFTLRPHWLDSRLCLHSFWLAFLADFLHPQALFLRLAQWISMYRSRWKIRAARRMSLWRSVELHAPSSCSHPGVPQAALLAHGIILASSCPNSKSGNHPGVILWTHVQKK